MKKLITTLTVAFAMGSLVGCSDVLDATGGDATGPTVKTSTDSGTITVSIPKSTKRSFDLATAQSQANYYEIVAYNDSLLGSAVVDSGDTAVQLTLPVAHYNVLVLAGRKPYSTAYLLGSGVKKNISVTANNVTKVTVPIKNSTFSATYPDTVQCGNSYTITESGNFGADVIELGYSYISVNGNSQYNYSPVSDSGYWSTSFTMTAPLSPTSYSVNLMYGSGLYLYDSTYSRNIPISSDYGFSGDWYLYEAYSTSDPYYNDLYKTIYFVSSTSQPTGLNVAIEWQANNN